MNVARETGLLATDGQGIEDAEEGAGAEKAVGRPQLASALGPVGRAGASVGQQGAMGRGCQACRAQEDRAVRRSRVHPAFLPSSQPEWHPCGLSGHAELDTPAPFLCLQILSLLWLPSRTRAAPSPPHLVANFTSFGALCVVFLHMSISLHSAPC